MNPEPLAKFREWAGKVPGVIIFPALVGCIQYEFTFAEGIHETGIIYELHKRTPYPPNHPIPKYSTVPPDFPRTDHPGAIHLEGAIAANDLLLKRDFVGTGLIN